ncbi:hypothetical protein BH23GEM11_BH23GEM11_08410 [soil metagenome]
MSVPPGKPRAEHVDEPSVTAAHDSLSDTPGVTGRTPPPPAPVLAWVERFGSASPSSESLCDRGAGALSVALDAPSGEREAAWALLAADALLTWAVEDAADAPEPAAALGEVLRAAQDPRNGPRP